MPLRSLSFLSNIYSRCLLTSRVLCLAFENETLELLLDSVAVCLCAYSTGGWQSQKTD